MGLPIRGKAQSRNEIVKNVSVKVGSKKKKRQISVFPVPQLNGRGEVMVKLKLLFFCPETTTLH